jgi:hypothetical protein
MGFPFFVVSVRLFGIEWDGCFSTAERTEFF